MCTNWCVLFWRSPWSEQRGALSQAPSIRSRFQLVDANLQLCLCGTHEYEGHSNHRNGAGRGNLGHRFRRCSGLFQLRASGQLRPVRPPRMDFPRRFSDGSGSGPLSCQRSPPCRTQQRLPDRGRSGRALFRGALQTGRLIVWAQHAIRRVNPSVSTIGAIQAVRGGSPLPSIAQ